MERFLTIWAKVLKVSYAVICSVAIFVLTFGELELRAAEKELEQFPDTVDTVWEAIPVEEQIRIFIENEIRELERQAKAEAEFEMAPEIAEDTVVEEVESSQEEEPIVKLLNTSAYCSCEICCGKTDGITASEVRATSWHTVAAGYSYPIGTRIYIPALADMPNGGWFVVEDRGGSISDDKLDIYFDSHQAVLEYGRKTLESYIYMP